MEQLMLPLRDISSIRLSDWLGEGRRATFKRGWNGIGKTVVCTLEISASGESLDEESAFREALSHFRIKS